MLIVAVNSVTNKQTKKLTNLTNQINNTVVYAMAIPEHLMFSHLTKRVPVSFVKTGIQQTITEIYSELNECSLHPLAQIVQYQC